MAIDINIPSQVKTYANLAGFPATGSLKTIFIAEDTNKTYRWTGSAYVEVSVADLSGYVPTTRTLTINGTTQDLSADRTFTISTGITIGTTAITSGTVGRVLFEGTGNVVQESANLFWDNTNGRLGIGTSSPTTIVHINGNTAGSAPSLQIRQQTNTTPTWFAVRNTDTLGSAGAISLDIGISGGSNQFFNGTAQGDIVLKAYSQGNTSKFFLGATSGSTAQMVLFPSTGNIGINTTTDSGYKLDVNGTARVSGLITATQNNIHATHVGANIKGLYIVNNADSVVRAGLQFNGSTAFVELVGRYNNGDAFFRQDGGNGNISFLRSGVEFGRIFGATGNWGINTTTDAGYKLDVNGTVNIGSSTNNVRFSSSASANFILHSTSAGYYAFLFPATNAYPITSSRETYVLQSGGNIKGFRFEAATGNSTMFINTSGGNQADQYVNIGGNRNTQNNTSAVLELESTIKGFLPPRMTTTQKNAIATPATGLMVYDTTLNVITYYNGTTWI